MAEEDFDHLYKHVKRGDLAAVKDFLDKGGDSNLSNAPTNEGGWNLVMVAAFNGKSQILSLLLDHRGRLEDATAVGETALALAAGGGYVKCVQLLLERGATAEIFPLGQPLSVYMDYCGGPYPNVQKVLTEAGAASACSTPDAVNAPVLKNTQN